MLALKLDWDISDLKQIKGRKVEKALVRALRMAGGDAIRTMKTDASRAIRAKKKFKLKTVNGALNVRFPFSKTDISAFVWKLDVSGRPTPIAEMRARQGRRGVNFQVNQGNRGFIKGAFIARMRSGHVGVFTRDGKARLPITEKFTTRVSDVFRDTGFIPDQFGRANRVFKSSFARLLALELKK